MLWRAGDRIYTLFALVQPAAAGVESRCRGFTVRSNCREDQTRCLRKQGAAALCRRHLKTATEIGDVVVSQKLIRCFQHGDAMHRSSRGSHLCRVPITVLGSNFPLWFEALAGPILGPDQRMQTE